MSIMSGCQSSTHMVSIMEAPCPECGDAVEIFVKERNCVEDAQCDACGYVIKHGTPVSVLNPQPL